MLGLLGVPPETLLLGHRELVLCEVTALRRTAPDDRHVTREQALHHPRRAGTGLAFPRQQLLCQKSGLMQGADRSESSEERRLASGACANVPHVIHKPFNTNGG